MGSLPVASWPLVTALVTFPLLPLTHLLLLRLGKLLHRQRALLAFGLANLAYVSIAAVLWLLWQRQAPSQEAVVWAGGALSGGLTVIFLIVGYLEAFELIDRGFSTQILVEVLTHGTPLSAAELQRTYGGGRGMDWMLQKRLSHMVRGGLLEVRQGTVHLKGPLAAFIGRGGVVTKGLLRLGVGG